MAHPSVFSPFFVFTVLLIGLICSVDYLQGQTLAPTEIGTTEAPKDTELRCFSCMRMEDGSETKEVDTSFFMAVFANTQYVLTKCNTEKSKMALKIDEVIDNLALENRTHVKPWLWMTSALLSNRSDTPETYRPYCMTLEFEFKKTKVIATTFQYMVPTFTHAKGQNVTCLNQTELEGHEIFADKYIEDGMNSSTIFGKLRDLEIVVNYSACFCNHTGCNIHTVPAAGHTHFLSFLLLVCSFIILLFAPST